MNFKIFFIVFIAFLSTSWAGKKDYPLAPNHGFQPEMLCGGRDVKGKRFRERVLVCERNVSSGKKYHVLKLYGLPEKDRRLYKIDHIIPLSFGGSNHVSNLWPMHKSLCDRLERNEYPIFERLKEGRMKHKEAIKKILSDKYQLVER